METEAKVADNNEVIIRTADGSDTDCGPDLGAERSTLAKPQFISSPAFQFYTKEFLSSSKVIAMSLTERGIYITLLAVQWEDGSLPTDMPALAGIVGMKEAPFTRLWPHNLGRCFVVRGGRLVNVRLEKERTKQEENRAQRSKNGSKGGRPKKESKKKAEVIPEITKPDADESTADCSLRTAEPSKAPVIGESKLDVWFSEFVALYPESRRRVDALASQAFFAVFEHESDKPALWALMRDRLGNHNKSEQWLDRNIVPSMAKWLAERRWVQTLAPSKRGSSPQVLDAAATRAKYLAS